MVQKPDRVSLAPLAASAVRLKPLSSPWGERLLFFLMNKRAYGPSDQRAAKFCGRLGFAGTAKRVKVASVRLLLVSPG
jgi:hypothetical protein